MSKFKEVSIRDIMPQGESGYLSNDLADEKYIGRIKTKKISNKVGKSVFYITVFGVGLSFSLNYLDLKQKLEVSEKVNNDLTEALLLSNETAEELLRRNESLKNILLYTRGKVQKIPYLYVKNKKKKIEL